MSDWSDAHNHLQDRRLSEAGVEASSLWGEGVGGCVVNATSEEEWDGVAALVSAHPGRIHGAYGIHPWKASGVSAGWLERLRARLEADPSASVGEIGLDGWVKGPGIGVQRPVFMDQLALAGELQRSATIHCLKAWGPLFEVFEQCPPPRRFLMHSFNGSLEVAEKLIPLGAYFSFSGHFLQPRKSKVVDVFRRLPLERILIETDAPDMTPPEQFVSHPLEGGLNHPGNLPVVGLALAGVLGLSPGQLQVRTTDNLRRFLGA